MPKKTKPLDPEHYFFVNDGRVLQSIDDLKKLLIDIDDNMFKYHVNSTKNDFYNWIKTSLMDKELAERIKKDTDKKDMLKHLKEKRKIVRKPKKRAVKRKPRKKTVKPKDKKIVKKKKVKFAKSVVLIDEKETNYSKVFVDYFHKYRKIVIKKSKQFLKGILNFFKCDKIDVISRIVILILILLILILVVYVR